MPRPSVFFDTSYVVALENKDDPHHERATRLEVELLKKKTKLVLHWGVTLEIADGYARRNRRARATEFLRIVDEEDRYRVVPITAGLLHDATQLYSDREDKEWGLTDCISFVLMKREKIKEALTADRHFKQAGFKALLLED